MTRLVYCTKLQKEAEGFENAPYPGDIGKKIHNSISKEAWGLWVKQQTMLINEYRLNLSDPKARLFLVGEMEKFLFGDGSERPAGFIPEK